MDDTIYRQAAIEVADAVWSVTGDKNVAKVWDQLKDLPFAQPEQQWIPCSVKLPEDGHEVWVTIKGHDVIYCREGETVEEAVERISKERWVTRAYWSKEENGWNDPTFGCPLIVSPIAWMDIDVPEPYREEQT